MAHTDIAQIASQLRQQFLKRSFGAIRFWRFAVVRPHDQAFEVVAVAVEGDRLDLSLKHASGAGHASVMSIWSPAGVEITAQGLTIRSAARLRMDENEAWLAGEEYRIRTPRGEGGFPTSGTVALTLET